MPIEADYSQDQSRGRCGARAVVRDGWTRVSFESLPHDHSLHSEKSIFVFLIVQAEEQAKAATAQAEEDAKNAGLEADQQARYDKAMKTGRPAQLYALAGHMEDEGRPDLAANLTRR